MRCAEPGSFWSDITSASAAATAALNDIWPRFWHRNATASDSCPYFACRSAPATMAGS